MTNTRTLKVTDEDNKVFLPINWSFLYLGNSRVYEELDIIKKGSRKVEIFRDNKENYIKQEIKRLEGLGFKAEIITMKELKELGVSND